MNGDIVLGNDFNLITENGDIKIGDSTGQELKLLLRCNKGEIKQHPTVGIGIDNYINSEDIDINELIHTIRKELKRDGFFDIEIDLDKGLIGAKK